MNKVDAQKMLQGCSGPILEKSSKPQICLKIKGLQSWHRICNKETDDVY